MWDDAQFSRLLDRKYDILQQHADAQTTQAGSGRLLAEGAFPRADNPFIQRELQRNKQAAISAGQSSGGVTDLGGMPDNFNSTDMFHYSHGATSVPGADPYAQHKAMHAMLMAARGANKVPGKGSGNVDTVPAMLAPGEAVLNKHAAEMLGRDKIATLNAMGNAMRTDNGGVTGGGMPPPKGQPAAPGKAQHYARGAATVDRLDHTNGQGWKGVGRDWQVGSQPALDPPLNARYVSPDYLPPPDTRGYNRGTDCVKPQKLAGGTHQVGHGKSAKTPAKIDPQAIIGLLGALRGGGAPAGGPGPMQPTPQPQGGGMV